MNKLYYKKFCLVVKDIEVIQKKQELYLELYNDCFGDFVKKKQHSIIEELNKKKENKSEKKLPKIEESNKKKEPPKIEDNLIEKKQKENTPLQKFMNKIKKLVSIKSHPDKVQGKEKLFKKAMTAWNKDDLFDLTYVSSVLDIDFPSSFSSSIYKEATEKLIEKKKNIMNTYAWVWFENIEKRELLRSHFSKSWNISVEDIKKREEEFENN